MKPNATLMTDDHPLYKLIAEDADRKHVTVNHSIAEYDHTEYLEQRARQCQQVAEGLIRRATQTQVEGWLSDAGGGRESQ